MKEETDRTTNTQQELTAQMAEDASNHEYDLIRAYANQLNGDVHAADE